MEKGKKKQTVLVGITGKVDSFVVAYLLKKQKFNCIGVSVIFNDNTHDDKEAFLNSKCQLIDLKKNLKNAEKLDIPFYAVDAKEIFRSNVVNCKINSTLSGLGFSHCTNCHQILIETLLKKAEKLGCDKIATGHYAKIKYYEKVDEYVLSSSKDLEDDQSYLLSRLSKDQLKKMVLPFGDMRKSEVEKIGKMMNAKIGGDISFEKDNHRCFDEEQKYIDYLNKSVPERFREKGDVKDLSSSNDILTEHIGIHTLNLGQNKFGENNDELDLKGYTLERISPNTNEVFVRKTEELSFEYCQLVRVVGIEEANTSKPKKAYAQIEGIKEKVGVFYNFKANNSIVLKFREPLKEGPVVNGKVIVLYERKKGYSDLICSGIAWDSGPDDSLNRIEGRSSEADLTDYIRNQRKKGVLKF